MSLTAKQVIISILGLLFLASLVFVQWVEVGRRAEESGRASKTIHVPESSTRCVDCHDQKTPGIIHHWKGSTHAEKGVGCIECHQAQEGEPDAYMHEGALIATIVTPLDCSRCHNDVYEEFEASHHAKAGNILASLDNFLAEVVEGHREGPADDPSYAFNPHGATPGRADITTANGRASAILGCLQCHGSKVAMVGTDGKSISVDDLKPGKDGIPTDKDALARIAKDENGKPKFDFGTWPNTGIGRLNLDGSRGSCSACHSRHDFSPRRARQPENCGKCHLGPDHPQKEIYEESKHGVAYRDMKDQMNLDSDEWVLGKDYSAAPTCATCHMSGHLKNDGKITHDPGKRISWTNRPPVSIVMDTDAAGKVIKETDPEKRAAMVADSWQNKRGRMKDVCSNCHTPDYINAFYAQYDDFVVLYNEKFAKPGKAIMGSLGANGILSKVQFDEKIEWTWFFLWHHEGRRARHGASMMAPDYAHWHGMYEVADRFYMELIPEALELCKHAEETGKTAEAAAVRAVIDEIMARPEHKDRIRKDD